MSGGETIELAASKSTNPQAFQFPVVMTQYRDCNFSVAGLKNTVRRHILQQEKLHGTVQQETFLRGIAECEVGLWPSNPILASTPFPILLSYSVIVTTTDTMCSLWILSKLQSTLKSSQTVKSVRGNMANFEKLFVTWTAQY
jgi:hypothetical protein